MPSNDQEGEREADERVQEELESLNRSMIDKAITIASNNNPASDLWPQFRKATFDYKTRRSEILESKIPKHKLSGKFFFKKKKKKSRQPFLCGLGPESKAEAENHDSLKHTIPEEDICILWPLSSALQKLLQIVATSRGVIIQNRQASISRLILSNLLIQGELLYQYAVRAVVRISSDTVVKINKSNDTTEVHILDHIHQHSQQIPAPIPFGMITIGKWSYTFMSFISGIPLDRIWGNLTSQKKCLVRKQLNYLFIELRRLPIPSNEGYLGGGTPQICKAGHRFKKTSSPIASEAQFNDFLLDDSWLEPAQLDYLRMSLPSDHPIVMTHGDVCPLNILVESEDAMDIAGIIDWETGGAYPEYWEYVNAFKSSFNSQGDWCLYLPEAGIGRFFNEYARHCIIGRFTKD